MLVFMRDDWEIEVDPRTWVDILDFLLQCRWESTVPTHRLLQVAQIEVNDQDAAALAAAGQTVLEETLKDPLAAFSTINFDMGTFAEIVEFASHGPFTVTQRQ